MRPEFIVGNNNLWLRSILLFSNYSSVVVFSFIYSNHYYPDMESFIFVIVHRINLVVWFFKVDWVYLGLMTINFSLRSICVGCISVFVAVFGYWYLLLLLFRSCYFTAFFIINNGPLKGQFSHFTLCSINNCLPDFFLKEICKELFLCVWDLWGPLPLIRYGLILTPCIFMKLLTMIWSIMVMKGIAKFSVDNSVNNGMVCWHVHIWYL